MKIVAFLDQSLYARSVVDHTAWLARATDASVELVYIISPNELTAAQIAPLHPSGPVMLNHDKEWLDARVAELGREGNALLDEARGRLNTASLFDIQVRIIQGNIADSMVEAAATASIAIMGKRGEHADLARLPLGSNLERLVRRAPVPVLAVSRSFRPIERMLLALDVDAESVSSVEALASGLLPARPLQLLHVGEQSERAQAALERASLQLGNSGFAVTASIVDGEPRHVIPEQVVLGSADLLAIGGFGGSWLKSLVLGSLTAELVRACQVPILLC